MLRPERLALELFEYKVADLQADRPVVGGVVSIWELHHYLTKLNPLLTDAERQRFYELSRALRGFSDGAPERSPAKPVLSDLVIEDLELSPYPGAPAPSPPKPPLDPALREEQRALQRLARRVWWSEFEEVLQDFAGRCRAEKDRATARLLYALCRNAEEMVRESLGANEFNLARVQVKVPVPERLDPLISLNSLDSIVELLREVSALVLAISDGQGIYGRLSIPRGHALEMVKKLALLIARDPYAGRQSAAERRGPSSAQLRLAMQELAKERLPEGEKLAQMRALEQRLKQALLLERQQREAFQQDVRRFTRVAEEFFDWLGRHLPVRAGGEAGEPHLAGGVLFAKNPALRLEKISPDAHALTVRLKGPTRFVLGGLELALTGSGRSLALSVSGQTYPLQPRLKLELDGYVVSAILESSYLHVRVFPTGRPLASLLAEALAVYTVLASPHAEALLAALRAAGTVAAGEPKEIVSQALERLRVVSAQAPERRTAIEGMLKGAARASGVTLPEDLIHTVVERFHAAMTADAGALPQLLANASASNLYPLTDEPLSLTIGNQAVTVRRYQRRGAGAAESVVVMVPGRIIGSFKNYMVQAFPGGVLVAARAQGQLAALYFEGSSLSLGRVQVQG